VHCPYTVHQKTRGHSCIELNEVVFFLHLTFSLAFMLQYERDEEGIGERMSKQESDARVTDGVFWERKGQ
jgi:hypothetical protein